MEPCALQTLDKIAQLLPPSTLRLTPVVVENEAAPRAVRQKTPKWRARRNQVKAEENRVRVRAKKKLRSRDPTAGWRSEEAGEHGSSMQYYSGNREREEREDGKRDGSKPQRERGRQQAESQAGRETRRRRRRQAGRRRSRNEEGREGSGEEEEERRREDQTQQREPAKLSEAFTASPFSSPLFCPLDYSRCMAARHNADPLPLSSVPFHAVHWPSPSWHALAIFG